MHFKARCCLLGLLLFSPGPASARVATGVQFGDGAVLQRDQPIPVWGTGTDGEKVVVSLNGQQSETVVKDGHWMVRLGPMRAGGPYTLTIQGENRLSFSNQLIGDVYLCSGQSNMEFPLRLVTGGPTAVASSADPQLRLLRVDRCQSSQPLSEVGSVQGWLAAAPATVSNFSAVAYFFGRALRQSEKVPIGLIMSCWGGTTAESWTSPAALAANPELRPLLRRYPEATLAYQSALYAGKGGVDAASEPNYAGHLYNGMIAGLVPYGMRGVIWYQGESNADRARQYRSLFPALIEDWRQQWGQGAFAFLFVQLAPFGESHTPAEEEGWAELREAQRNTAQRVDKTAMVVITDHGSQSIHPLEKQPVGERLALAARRVVYGEPVEYSGPLFESLKLDGPRALVRFTHVDKGLRVSGGPELTDFALAGADGQFHPATARLVGVDQVELSSPSVPEPLQARYGWALNPHVNLFNSDGLPASPFTSVNP